MSWDASCDPVPVITEWCPGTPDRPMGQGPGYTVKMVITPDQDARWQPGQGMSLEYSRHIGEDALGAAPDLRGVLEVICRNVGLRTAEAFANELEAYIVREIGQRPMTPQERYEADRRRSSAPSPMEQALNALDDATLYAHVPPAQRPVSRTEREVWESGMVPANPALCRHCGRRIVFAYPQWTLDSELEPGVDPSVCPRSSTLGHYHEPEGSNA